MSEARLTADVMGYAASIGLLAHHCPDSRRCQGRRGFPDVLALGPGGILLAELKDRDGDTSAAQDLWLWMAHTAGIPYAVYRPQDWEDGRIRARLQALVSR